MIGTEGIIRIIPHRFPVLLVDRVTEVVPGERLTAVKAVSANEPCYRGVDDFRYPPSLLVESWMQAAALLMVWNEPNPDVTTGKALLVNAIDKVTFHGSVRPGDVVEHRVEMVRSLADCALLRGEVRLGSVLVVQVGHFLGVLRTCRESGSS